MRKCALHNFEATVQKWKKPLDQNIGKKKREEKILVTSISSFCYKVFYPMKEKLVIGPISDFLYENTFNLDNGKVKKKD